MRNSGLRSAPGSIAASWLLPLVVLLAIIVLWGYRTQSLLYVPSFETFGGNWGMSDFAVSVYFPVRAMLDGVNPYYTTLYQELYPVHWVFPLYSPAVLLFNLPFALLPYPAAAFLYFICSAALIPVVATMLIRIGKIPCRPGCVLWLSAFLAAGRPVYANLTLGQSSLPVAIGVLLALHYARSRPAVGGIGLALATLKPSFGVPLALFMLVRKDLRALAIGVSLGAIAALIPTLILIAGPSGIEGFTEGIPDNFSHYGSDPDNDLLATGWKRIDASVALVRLLGFSQGPGLGLIVAVAGLGLAAWIVHRVARLGVSSEVGASGVSGSIVCLAMIVSVLHQTYDALIVSLPLLLAVAASTAPWNSIPRRTRWLLAGLLLVVWFNYLSSGSGLVAAGLSEWTPGWRMVTSIDSVVLMTAFVVLLRLGNYSTREHEFSGST